MKYSLTFLALLLLFTTYVLASPIVDLEERDEDCYMEWITVYGEAPTGSSASPALSAAALTGAGKPIMRHSRYTTSTSAAPAESSTSGTVVVDAVHTNAPVEVAKQYVKLAKAASSSDAAPSISSSSSTTSSSVVASSSAVSPAPSTGGSTSLIPGGKKAGISGFEGVTTQAAWTQFTSKISWYSDYTPNPANYGSVKGIGMVRPAIPQGHYPRPFPRRWVLTITTSYGAMAVKARKTPRALPPSPAQSPRKLQRQTT